MITYLKLVNKTVLDFVEVTTGVFFQELDDSLTNTRVKPVLSKADARTPCCLKGCLSPQFKMLPPATQSFVRNVVTSTILLVTRLCCSQVVPIHEHQHFNLDAESPLCMHAMDMHVVVILKLGVEHYKTREIQEITEEIQEIQEIQLCFFLVQFWPKTKKPTPLANDCKPKTWKMYFFWIFVNLLI